jgi:hypothetical protein
MCERGILPDGQVLKEATTLDELLSITTVSNTNTHDRRECLCDTNRPRVLSGHGTNRAALMAHLAQFHQLDPSASVEQQLLQAAIAACAADTVGAIHELAAIATELDSIDGSRFKRVVQLLARHADEFEQNPPNLPLISIDSLFHGAMRELRAFDPDTAHANREHFKALLGRVEMLAARLSLSMHCARSYRAALSVVETQAPEAVSDRVLLAASLRATDPTASCTDLKNTLMDSVTVPALMAADPGVLAVLEAAFSLPTALLAQVGEVPVRDAVAAVQKTAC